MSKQLKTDLMNNEVDRNKNYGVCPLFVLSKIVQELKPHQTVQDLLPLIPPVVKKSNVKKRLRPEVLTSNLYIQQEKELLEARKVALETKIRNKQSKEERQKKLFDFSMELSDLKCQKALVTKHIEQLKETYKLNKKEMSQDEFNNQLTVLQEKKKEVLKEIKKVQAIIKDFKGSNKSKENSPPANQQLNNDEPAPSTSFSGLSNMDFLLGDDSGFGGVDENDDF